MTLPPSPSAHMARFRTCHTCHTCHTCIHLPHLPADQLPPSSGPQVGYIFHCAFLMRQEEPAEECKVGSCGWVDSRGPGRLASAAGQWKSAGLLGRS